MKTMTLLWVVLGLGLGACGDEGAVGADTRDAVFVPEVDGGPDGLDGEGLDGEGLADGDVPDTTASDTGSVDTATSDTALDTGRGEATDTTTVDTGSVDTAVVDSSTGDTADVGGEDTWAAPDVTPDVGSPDVEADVEPDGGPAPYEPPLVDYVKAEPRRLFFLNNPEQLLTTELGDATFMDATLLRVTASGPSRSFFEHLNKSGRTIGFGIQLYNGGAAPVTVTVRGVGFVVGIAGGLPFSQALNGEGAVGAQALGSGKSLWIMRKDEVVPNGSFFSGVVDFDVEGGAVTVNHIAYDSFAGLDGSTAERDYVQRVEPDGTHEARMYKGVGSASEVVFAPTFELAAGQAAGPLEVATRRWDLVAGAFGAAGPDDGWTSHIGPGQNAAATTSDMVSFSFRDWVFDPLVKSDGEGKYPNLGNWGVVYRLRATVRNAGPVARTVSWRLVASPGAGAGLAKQAGAGAWTSHQLAAGQAMTLASRVVPAGGEAVLEGAMVLGGPSGGALRQSVVLE